MAAEEYKAHATGTEQESRPRYPVHANVGLGGLAVWSGWGWIGYILWLIPLVAALAIASALFGPGFIPANSWIYLISGLANCGLYWVVGRRLNRDLPVRILGIRSMFSSRTDGHTILFVRLEFAGLMFFPLFWWLMVR